MRSGNTRVPLLVAGLSAVATYLLIGSSSPFDGFHLARAHEHLREHTAALMAHFRTDSRPRESRHETENRPDAGFDEIVLDNTVGATITIGDKPSVSVTPQESATHNARTTIRDGKLTVTGAGSSTHLAVTLPHLRTLRINGPGNITLVGLHDPLSIVANGPATLQATGVVDSLTLTLNGPSNLCLAKLQAKNVSIRMNGGGDAEIFATENLVAEVHGVGRVRYLGDPQTVTKIDGSGSIGPLTVSSQG